MKTGATRKWARLLQLYDLYPFHDHPLWRAVLEQELSLEQVLRAEAQHYLRTRSGQALRTEALNSAQAMSPVIFEALVQTVLEECTTTAISESHLDLIRRLLILGGVSEVELDRAQPTPGNAAAIALYRDISARGVGCHMVGAGVVEHFYAQLAPQVFRVYTTHYGMSSHQAETYSIHGSMDAGHANRAFQIMEEAVRLHGWEAIELSVRDAFVATSLHYDGMLQAATNTSSFWSGRGTL